MVNEYPGNTGEDHLYKLLCELAYSHTALRIEIDRLNKVIAKELSENDELGCEYTYVNTLRIELKELQDKFKLLRRYHGGDGTVTREQVMEALGGA